MTDWGLGALGIILSLAFFLVGYRQTVGAKKERIRQANAELERMLVRRIVLEDHMPTRLELGRLIDGKARDFRVHSEEVLSPEELITTVFTRVVESDLIPQDRREHIVKRVEPALLEAEQGESSALPSDLASALPRILSGQWGRVFAMGFTASVAGAVSSVLLETRAMAAREDLLPLLLGITASSLSIITFVIAVLWLRESEEEAGQLQPTIGPQVLERRVYELLERYGSVSKAESGRDRGFDYMLEHADERLLIKLMAWNRPVPSRLFERHARWLLEALEREKASRAIIVTLSGATAPTLATLDPRIKMMAFRQFRHHFEHLGASW